MVAAPRACLLTAIAIDGYNRWLAAIHRLVFCAIPIADNGLTHSIFQVLNKDGLSTIRFCVVSHDYLLAWGSIVLLSKNEYLLTDNLVLWFGNLWLRRLHNLPL